LGIVCCAAFDRDSALQQSWKERFVIANEDGIFFFREQMSVALPDLRAAHLVIPSDDVRPHTVSLPCMRVVIRDSSLCICRVCFADCGGGAQVW